MLRRLIANSLIAVACLTVFVPLALAVQSDPMPACCRRGARHYSTCCTGKKSEERGPGFRDASRSCPCGSQRKTCTVRDNLLLQGASTERSPALEVASPASSWFGRSLNRIHHSERGPPRLWR